MEASDAHQRFLNRRLLSAAQGAGVDTIEAMLWRGAEVNCCDSALHSPLHFACLYLPREVPTLLKAGAAVHARSEHGLEPLHFAVSLHSQTAVRALLVHGANPNAVSNNGTTPLMFTVSERHDPQMMRLLLSHGADMHFINLRGESVWTTATDEDQRILRAWWAAHERHRLRCVIPEAKAPSMCRARL